MSVPTPVVRRAVLAGLGVLAALSAGAPAVAQGTAASVPSNPGIEAEGDDLAGGRARIKAERDRIGALKAREQRDCQDRFAVNDCMNAVERRWRAPLADLRRQELAIQDVERRRRSAEQVRDAEARAAQAQAEAAQRRERAVQDRESREARAARKADGPRPAGNPRESTAPPKPGPGPSPGQAAANASEHARRVQEARERKRKAQARAAQEEGKGKPLPVPP